MNELLCIDIQEYINERHSLNEMSELYDKFEDEIKKLKSKGDGLNSDEQTILRILELKAFQLLREIDNATR